MVFSTRGLHLFGHNFDNAVLETGSVCVYLVDLKTGLLHESIPLIPGPLFSCQRGHHDHVNLGCLPVGTSVGDDHVINQDNRVRPKGSNCILQDVNSPLIGVVVDDVAHVVYSCTWREVLVSIAPSSTAYLPAEAEGGECNDRDGFTCDSLWLEKILGNDLDTWVLDGVLQGRGDIFENDLVG
jgi:hypothetical protein